MFNILAMHFGKTLYSLDKGNVGLPTKGLPFSQKIPLHLNVYVSFILERSPTDGRQGLSLHFSAAACIFCYGNADVLNTLCSHIYNVFLIQQNLGLYFANSPRFFIIIIFHTFDLHKVELYLSY